MGDEPGPDALSAAEGLPRQCFVGADRDQQFYVFLVLAAFTGARRAQLLGLRWHNGSLTEERVAFRVGWVDGPDGPVLADTKTKQSHVVDLDPGTCEILAGYAETLEAPVGEGFVFSDDGGATAWKPNRVTKTFLRYRRAVGLRSFRLHDLWPSWPPRCSRPEYRS